MQQTRSARLCSSSPFLPPPATTAQLDRKADAELKAADQPLHRKGGYVATYLCSSVRVGCM